MQTSIAPQTVVDRTFAVENLPSVYERVSEGLGVRGFAIQQTEPPVDGLRGSRAKEGPGCRFL